MQNSKDFENNLLMEFPFLKEMKTRGILVWQICRTSFLFKANTFAIIDLENDTTSKKQSRYRLLKTILVNSFYGWHRLFKKQRAILLTDILEERFIEGKYNDKIGMSIIEYYGKGLLVIKKMIDQSIFPQKKYAYKNWAPDSLLHLATYALSQIMRLFGLFALSKKDLELLQKVNEANNIHFEWQKTIRLFWASHFIFSGLLKMTRAKTFYINCSYGTFSQGTVYAAKQKGVSAVELQHGIILNHEAYNIPQNIGKETHPDYLCIFGDYVKQEVSKNFCKPQNIISTGSVFLQYIYKKSIDDDNIIEQFQNYKKKFSFVVSVSEQIGFNKAIYSFIKVAAKQCPQVLFVLMPRKARNIGAEFQGFSNIVENKFITHENIIHSDIHATIHSTTAFESWYFGVPVLFMNIEGASQDYFGRLLENDSQSFFRFTDTPEKFCEELKKKDFAPRKEIQEYGKKFYAEPMPVKKFREIIS